MTSRCKGLRSDVSFANEGRKFGSLENNTTERAISVWICISRGMILETDFTEFSFQLTSANIPKLSLQLRDQLPWGFQGDDSGNQLHLQPALGSSHSRAFLSLRAPREWLQSYIHHTCSFNRRDKLPIYYSGPINSYSMLAPVKSLLQGNRWQNCTWFSIFIVILKLVLS